MQLSGNPNERADTNRQTIISAIKNKAVLKFIYDGKPRIVEPQTYGRSTAGREVLRAHERRGSNTFARSGMAKLFDLEKISDLERTGEAFESALAAHNPNDSAMIEVFATLPAATHSRGQT
jgi:hypothetical protein